ncbi:MAG: hypothetical protein IKD72_06755, partial [Clostridia bacterium]|nr:hypothetical protein [Clostridia bacterium]
EFTISSALDGLTTADYAAIVTLPAGFSFAPQADGSALSATHDGTPVIGRFRAGETYDLTVHLQFPADLALPDPVTVTVNGAPLAPEDFTLTVFPASGTGLLTVRCSVTVPGETPPEPEPPAPAPTFWQRLTAALRGFFERLAAAWRILLYGQTI